MTAALFIDEQARQDLLVDAAGMAVLEVVRQPMPMQSVLRVYARRIVDLFVRGLLP